MTELEDVLNPENWTTSELFNYCQVLSIIAPDEEFENWKHNRTDLLRMVKDDIANNINNVDL